MTGRPHEFRGRWAKFVDSFGGVALAVAELGIDEETLRRWARGVIPRSVMTKRALNQIARARGVPALFPKAEKKR